MKLEHIFNGSKAEFIRQAAKFSSNGNYHRKCFRSLSPGKHNWAAVSREVVWASVYRGEGRGHYYIGIS